MRFVKKELIDEQGCGFTYYVFVLIYGADCCCELNL